MGRCIIFCISDICLFLNFNELKKKQSLQVVSITDAKKKNQSAKIGGIRGEEKIYFAM